MKVGSTITVKKGNVKAVYTIVGSYEAKPENGMISDESPLGKAFLTHKVGDSVKVSTPTGAIMYEIIKVE